MADQQIKALLKGYYILKFQRERLLKELKENNCAEKKKELEILEEKLDAVYRSIKTYSAG